MTVVEENLLLFTFDYRPDINKVLRDGLWRLNDHPLAIIEAKPGLKVKDDLNLVPYWVQIYNVTLLSGC